MKQQNLTAVILTATIAIAGEHYDEGDILMVDADIDKDTAKQLVRLRRAEPSDARRGRRKAAEEAKQVKREDPPPPPPPPPAG